MARGEGETSAKRAKVDETDEKEKEDPLVRRKEEVVRLLEEARAKGKGNARAKEELVTLCARLEAKNEKLFRRLLPELWQKIVDEYLDENDELAFAMTCRFFREQQEDLGWELMTNLKDKLLLEDQESGNVTPHTLGWFQWVCDNWEIQPGFKWRYEKVKGAVYECDLLNYAAFQGSIEILRWLMEEKGWELNRETGWWAGMGGSVEVFEYLGGKGYEITSHACSGAARGGHLKALKFLRGLDPPCPWGEETCEWAARNGHLDVLQWARSQDPPCPWDTETCAYAADGGHLNVLKFLRSQNPPCPWNEDTCTYAASGGHLEVLKWLRAQNPPCPWSAGTCALAAQGGHLEVLKWARSQDPPCPWNERTCILAAGGGHLDVLKWARCQDPPCPWSRPWSRPWSECRELASQYGQLHIINWIDQQEDEIVSNTF